MSRDAPISARSREARVSQKHTGPRARCDLRYCAFLSWFKKDKVVFHLWDLFQWLWEIRFRLKVRGYFFLLPIFLWWIRFKVFFVHSERSMQHSDHHRAVWTWLLMMSMSFMSDTLNSSDPSKSAFLEFGHGLTTNQQHLSGFSHNIYPVHGLHSGGHLQHDGPYSTASHYSRPLGYAYPGPVSAPAPGAYVPYQPNSHSSSLAHTRAEDTSEYPLKTVQMWGFDATCFLKDTCVCRGIYCQVHNSFS